MPSQVDERTVDGSPESSPMNTTAAAAAAAQDVIPSLVSQTDGITDEIQEKDQRLTSCRHEIKRSSRPPHLKPRASREPSSDPRPSVVNFVVTEVATFHDVFGILGVPMVIVFLVSAAWTFMLVAIQVHAATIANAVMNTTEFDNGEFWLLPKPETPLVVASAILFTLFGVGYTALAVMIVFFYRAGALKDAETSIDPDPGMNNSSRYSSTIQQKKTKQNFVQNMILWARGLPEDVCEHYFTAALDLPKLVFQTITLYTYLRQGFPTPIIYYYSIMLLCNWFAASYRSQHYVVDPNLIIARLYYTFDLFFAVFAPLVVLIYYVYTFKFDREEFLTRVETLSPRTFDNVARIFGDPAQISSFCNAFHYLQFSSGTSLFYKSALNLLSLYKWRKMILTLIHNHHERQLERKRKALIEPKKLSSPLHASVKATITKKLSSPISTPKFGKHFVPKLFLSLIFFGAGVHNFVYSIGSVHSTRELCSKYDKCALYSYWWNFGEKHCTCLVFADRETTPTTYAEWTSPNDTTANLAELAMAGELRIVQIVNRAVPDLPEELTRCHRLEQLILLYTKTIHLPEWLSEFRSLEYFHVEGDFTDRRLQTIPDGMFNHLEHLSFLHLGTLPALKTLPSMASLKNVRYLTLAVLSSLIEISSFEGLSSVSDLNLIHLPSAPTLPSLAPLKRLTQMVILPRSAVCCSGYISGTCNMTEPQCLPIANESHPLVCTDERISAEDKAKLDSFGDTICPPSMHQDIEQAAPCKYSTDVLCGGVLYKECSFNGKQGMCFNSRMMVINCETTPNYIAMRKLQIERGVGKECDPEVEAWLGCPNN